MREVGAVIAGAVLLIGLLLFGVIELGRWKCNAAWKDSGRQNRFLVIGGCQVHDGTGWVPAKNYRAF